MNETNTAEREALQAYLKDCDAHAIVPDVGGAWHAAFQAARASLAASAGSEPVATEFPPMPETWHVSAHVLGQPILTIGYDWLAGKGELSDAETQAVIGMAQHLLAFVGYGLPPSNFDPDADDKEATKGEHAQTEALRPKFGDLLRNTMASESNPRRDAYFIREVHRSGGGVNPGRWFEMTDGKGETWLSNPQNLVPATPAQPAAPQGVAYAGLPDGEPSNVELRGMWYGAGGSFHGPNVETGTMPEAKLLPFLRSLASHGQAPAGAKPAHHYGPLRDADAEYGKPLSVYTPSPQAAQQAPAGATLPAGWVPLVINHEGQYPEEVAYGPQILMDRLGKWLRKYFDSVVADKAGSAGAVPDLQPLHNLLYLAQRQTSPGAMQRVVGEARLELAKVRDVTPTAQAAPAAGAVAGPTTAGGAG